eukprot:TRINITY_DN57722_c0_g1_i2.p1 TRINITY_DN57722_c0_g1~~TRINITY_DN57722_c0_g1_i2.p1  ORF type:complete len:308 (-),score=15.74 TRINITY_DN57722_c0_g1_i2:171-1094(-)
MFYTIQDVLHGLTSSDFRYGLTSSPRRVASLTNKEVEGTCYTFRCSRALLAWEQRWPMLREIILEHDPDVIGLQEVDCSTGSGAKSHNLHVRRDLSDAGYDGTFLRKKGRAVDGLALFWKRKRLRPCSRKLPIELPGSTHVALGINLTLDGEHSFTVCVSHLKAGIRVADEVQRESQAKYLLEQFRDQNLILLGDLNGHCRPFKATHETWINPRMYKRLHEDFHLQSAYREVMGREPNFTCWAGLVDREVRGVFDYIMFRKDRFQAKRVLALPSNDDVVACSTRLPNAAHPSDHMPLIADLCCRPQA